ncbi:MAG: hypothetical protein MJ010_08810 [Paludibacteraceae bacterium]|nr:hypothetical protein [Paludibacteraceae bacterium]
MKKLLFLGIVALMVQSLGAVTLPSTSYSPYAGSTSSTGESFITDGGTMVSGSYNTLGSNGEWDDECTGKIVGTDKALCFECCSDKAKECASECGTDIECLTACANNNASCSKACEAHSLPLDGGLSILLLLSLAGGAAKLLRNRKV